MARQRCGRCGTYVRALYLREMRDGGRHRGYETAAWQRVGWYCRRCGPTVDAERVAAVETREWENHGRERAHKRQMRDAAAHLMASLKGH